MSREMVLKFFNNQSETKLSARSQSDHFPLLLSMTVDKLSVFRKICEVTRAVFTVKLCTRK